jgi:hypothetical protein
MKMLELASDWARSAMVRRRFGIRSHFDYPRNFTNPGPFNLFDKPEPLVLLLTFLGL